MPWETEHVSLAVISDEVPTNRPGLKQNAALFERNEEGGRAGSDQNINSDRLQDGTNDDKTFLQ